MTSVCLYLQIHQPYRLRPDYNYFAIGRHHRYWDTRLNRQVMERVAGRCYRPLLKQLGQAARRSDGAFRCAIGISGVAIEQLREWDSLQPLDALHATGAVDWLGETYYHSLAALSDGREFQDQVEQHARLLHRLWGVRPRAFRNTELLYSDAIAATVRGLGYDCILAEGFPPLLGPAGPHVLYEGGRLLRHIPVLVRDYSASDAIAFRYKQPGGAGDPAYFARRLRERAPDGVVMLGMDAETFGEHQPASSGIFAFLDGLIDAVVAAPDMQWCTPAELAAARPAETAIHARDPVSWADAERDTSAWLGNEMQRACFDSLYELGEQVRASDSRAIKRDWRRLQTSDLLYYQSTRTDDSGAVHQWFTPYATPHDAHLLHSAALTDLRARLALDR